MRYKARFDYNGEGEQRAVDSHYEVPVVCIDESDSEDSFTLNNKNITTLGQPQKQRAPTIRSFIRENSRPPFLEAKRRFHETTMGRKI